LLWPFVIEASDRNFGVVIMSCKMVVALAAVLFAGSGSTALGQGTGGGHAPSPGTGGGGTFVAPAPGIGTGATPNITPTPGVGTSANPSGTSGGGAPSSGRAGEKASGEKPASGGPARTTADIKEETEAGIPYQPCPANVRFANGQQMCLGLPIGSRPYRSPPNR
jgi:hypothetical protein